MSFPNDETGSVLAEMHDAGVELDKILTVEFFQLFEDENNAKAFAKQLSESDVATTAIKVHPDQTPNVWDVDCCVEIIPSYNNIVKFEDMFEKLAGKHKGYNDGWGAHID